MRCLVIHLHDWPVGVDEGHQEDRSHLLQAHRAFALAVGGHVPAAAKQRHRSRAATCNIESTT
jgi:hypothetical protein